MTPPLAVTSMTQGISLFFSYSHQDEALRDELAKHLSLLERQGVLSSWHDRAITPGSEWAGQIDLQLEQAQIILLLVSSDFLASHYCYDIELKRAMERQAKGEATVIPVILRPVDWQSAGFSQLQALPKNAKPVTTWNNQDEAFTDIARGIRRVAEGISQARAPQPVPKDPSGEAPSSDAAPLPPIENLEFPDGQVPLGSPFYVERPPIEADCFAAVEQPSALIRIKAPRQVGKSSLMARILDHAQQQGQQAVQLSFQEADDDIFESLDSLLKWLCASIAIALDLPPQVEQSWTEPLAKKQKCSNYLQNYILPKVSRALVLGFDEVDRVFEYPKIASDFLGMLRSWHDAKKNNPTWQRLRLVITHSQEVYVPLNINQSPFNVGLPVTLPEFTPEQVADLACRHGLNLGPGLTQLMQLLGGHPYLLRMALYELARGRTTLEDFLAEAPTQAGPYGEHLRHHLDNLNSSEALRSAMLTVVMANDPVHINDQAAFKLKSMGLVRVHGDTVEPLGELYRLYFRSRLGG